MQLQIARALARGANVGSIWITATTWSPASIEFPSSKREISSAATIEERLHVILAPSWREPGNAMVDRVALLRDVLAELREDGRRVARAEGR
jgi:hypothetical protein